MLAFPRDMSNALLVSAAHSVTGRPLAVMGPQVAYFAPEILMEQDIHGPGVDATGAAFPGRTCTSNSGTGVTTPGRRPPRAEHRRHVRDAGVQPEWGKVALNSNYYLLQGRCVPMETLTRTESWTKNLADSTPSGSSRSRPSARRTGS